MWIVPCLERLVEKSLFAIPQEIPRSRSMYNSALGEIFYLTSLGLLHPQTRADRQDIRGISLSRPIQNLISLMLQHFLHQLGMG